MTQENNPETPMLNGIQHDADHAPRKRVSRPRKIHKEEDNHQEALLPLEQPETKEPENYKYTPPIQDDFQQEAFIPPADIVNEYPPDIAEDHHYQTPREEFTNNEQPL